MAGNQHSPMNAPRRAAMTSLRAMAAAITLAGCASQSPPLYYWGSYEDLIYSSYDTPDIATAQMQIDKLEADYQQARAQNRRMPPGWHAHMGYLYFQLGKLEQAQQSFLTEKAEFPESAVLMDRLLANLK
jgi:hypothetical protein